MDSHRLSPQVNGKDMTGGQANESLSELGVQLPKSGTSQPRKVLNWILRDNDYRWEAKYSLLAPVVVQPGIASQETEISFQEADDEALFPEGREIYRLHRTKERNTSVVELAKRRAFQQDNLLRCEACGFSFTERYGELGRGFIEAHHTLPLSELTEQTMTRVEDLALVCSNCHKMLHKKRPWLRTPELKSILQVSQPGN